MWQGIFAVTMGVAIMLAGGCGRSAGPAYPDAEPDAIEAAVHERQVIYVSAGGDHRIEVFEVDSETGELTALQQVELPGAVGALTPSHDRELLYAAVRSEQAVSTLAIDQTTGELELLDTEPIGLNAVYLYTDRTGQYLLSADYGGATVASHRLDDDGTVIGEPLQMHETDRHAHALEMDAAERFAFVPHTGPSAVYQFRFDAETGLLEPNDPENVIAPDEAGPRHIRFHPHLPERAYTVNELDSSVTVWAMDPETGTLSEVQNLTMLPEDWEEDSYAAEIHLTPDGRFLYATNRGHDSIAVYAVDAASGELEFVHRAETEAWPRGMTVDGNGRFVYAAGQHSDQLAAYGIDPESGRLTPIATYPTGEGPAWIELFTLD